MSNQLHDQRMQYRGGLMDTPGQFSKVRSVAGRKLLIDAARAQTLLDVAAMAREPARAGGMIARACKALIHINECLRTLEIEASMRGEIEKARNALRLRLAQLDSRVTRH